MTGKLLGRLANQSDLTCGCCTRSKPKRRWKRDERQQWRRDEDLS